MASMSSETDLLVSACCGHTFALSRLQSVRFIEEQHFPLRALRTVAERANGVVRCSVCGEPSLVDSVCDSTSDKHCVVYCVLYSYKRVPNSVINDIID